jgi:hypothetical protein
VTLRAGSTVCRLRVQGNVALKTRPRTDTMLTRIAVADAAEAIQIYIASEFNGGEHD